MIGKRQADKEAAELARKAAANRTAADRQDRTTTRRPRDILTQTSLARAGDSGDLRKTRVLSADEAAAHRERPGQDGAVGRVAKSSRGEATATESAGGSLTTFLAILVGFVAACALFFLKGYWKERLRG